MKKNKHIVHIEGYWLLENLKCIPNLEGIFFIYECRYDDVSDIVEIKDLLYIGSSRYVREEIGLVLKADELREYILLGKKLCFSYAAILDQETRLRVFNQYLHFMKPVLNRDDMACEKEIDSSIVISIGDVALLEPVCDNYVLN